MSESVLSSSFASFFYQTNWRPSSWKISPEKISVPTWCSHLWGKAGWLPFSAETPMAVMFKHILDPLPPPGSLVRELPGKIERIILKAMAKEPSSRHEKAENMVFDLNSALMEVNEHLIPSFSVRAAESLVAPFTVPYNAETIPAFPNFVEKMPISGQARVKTWFSIRSALLMFAVLVSASLFFGLYTSRDSHFQQGEVAKGVGNPSSLDSRPQPQSEIESGVAALSPMSKSPSPGPAGGASFLPDVGEEKKSISNLSEKTQLIQDQIGEALDNEQTETALGLLNTLLAQHSDLAEPYCQRGYIMFEKEFFSSAKADFIKCRENIRDSDPEELGGEAAAMEALAEARILAFGQNGATEHLEVVDKALERADAPSWLRCERAQLNMDLEDYEAALTDFQACGREPELDPYWRARVESGSEEARGNIASEQGNQEAALEHFRKWAELAPSDADPHCHQGDIYNDQELYKKGLQSFQRCAQLARDPEVKQWADFSIAVSSGLLAKQRGESDQAVDFLNRALALNSTEVWIHCELGDLHAHIGKKEQAKKYFLTCRSLAGDDRDLRQWADDMLKELK